MEDRDYYLEKNVFRVPALARWKTVQDSAKLPPGTEILKERGRLAHSYKITSTGKLIDDALEAIERDNPSLRGVLPKRYAREDLDKRRLGELIELSGRISRRDSEARSKDGVGRGCGDVRGR